MPQEKQSFPQPELSDFAEGLTRWRFWGSLAWYDIRSRYSRTWLGPVWTLASLLFFIGVTGAVYTEIMNQDPSRYIPHLAVGWIIWAFVSNCILNGCQAFLNGKRLIKEIRVPLSIHLYRVICRNFVIFLYHCPVLVVILLLSPHNILLKALTLSAALFLIVANVLWIIVILGVVCTRFRDLFEIVTNVVRIMFLLTPIIWTPDMISSRTLLLELNPFFHLIEVFRAPLLEQDLRPTSWWVLAAGLALGWPLALYILAKFKDRIPFLV
jgi:lipopolysaccharide transport system permease protein